MKYPFTGKKRDDGKETCFVYGDDRRFMKKALESTGAFFVNDHDLFAYFNPQGSMGLLAVETKVNGEWQEKIIGQCALLFEQAAAPYDFSRLCWDDEKSNESNILSDARMEGIGDLIKEQKEDERWMRFMPALYGLLAILGLVVLIIGLQFLF